MRGLRSLLVALAVGTSLGAATLGASAQRADQPRVGDLMALTARYLDDFIGRFSNVVSEEQYQQEVWAGIRGTTMPRQRRTLRSDFLLVKPEDAPQWHAFRDVFEVDGAPVRDREQRLARLFLQASGTALERAGQIADESARYNIGPRRTVNNPVLALAFLSAGNQPRFRYEIDGRDNRTGSSVWVVKYREISRPTLITGANGQNLPAEGRYSIDASNGRVAKAALDLADTSIVASVTTTFTYDEGLGIAVPAAMDEIYRLTSSGGQIAGHATYGRFRRFDVTATETIDTPR